MNNIKLPFGLILCAVFVISTASNFSLAEAQGEGTQAATEVSNADESQIVKNVEEVDHSGMDHSKMDHSQMGHSMSGDHGDHNMTLDAEGMVMNTNDSTLPRDCKSISKEYYFQVKAGVEYARPYPGTVFGMSEHEFKVEPCSKINVTFTNEDKVRHQWMVHQLPKYLYPQGMFHLEAAGGATKTGTFIVPSDNKTYLVHCDVAQHMEKGMKAQLVVGKGSGDLPSIPGISRAFRPDSYPTTISPAYLWLGFVLSVLATVWLGRKLI